MSLKDFVECFDDAATIKIVLAGGDSVLYNGDAETLKKLLVANVKRRTGKLVDGLMTIEVNPY